MATLRKADQRLLDQLSQLALCNPFSPERLRLEQSVLGKQFHPEDITAWNRNHAPDEIQRPNVTRLAEVTRAVIQRVQQDAAEGRVD